MQPMPHIPPRPIPASLSVVMPVYNEEDAIETVVADYLTLIGKFQLGELVLVNDKSTDKTLEILSQLVQRDSRIRVFSNEVNRGHGPTLTRAYREARGEYIFHVDSDNQFMAEDFWLLWNALEQTKADIAIGRRIERNDPFARLILTRCLKVTLLLLFGMWPPDANCPFRLYRKDALAALLPLIAPTAHLPSISLTVAGYRMGYKTEWVTVRHLARRGGQSFVRSFKIFRLVFISFGELLTFRRLLPQKKS
jgi:glycosyltransferase involved in cell wall biosynthesis